MIFTYLEDIRRRKTSIESSIKNTVSSVEDINELIRAGHQITNLALQAQVQFKNTLGLDRFINEASVARTALDEKIKAALTKLPRSDKFEVYAKALSSMLGEVSVLGPIAEFRSDKVYTFAEQDGKYGLAAGPALSVPKCDKNFNEVLNTAARLVGANYMFVGQRKHRFEVKVKAQSKYATTYELKGGRLPLLAKEVEKRFKDKFRCTLVEASLQGNILELVHIPGIEDEHVRYI